MSWLQSSVCWLVTGLIEVANQGAAWQGAIAPPVPPDVTPASPVSEVLLARQGASLPTVSIHQLPPEVKQTVTLIRQGGPFPYAKDGMVFGNREQLLPSSPRGYYREYTVPTPGAKNRGARRLVVGGANESYYYTGDHYRSFVRIKF